MRYAMLVTVATTALLIGCSEDEHSLFTKATASITGKGAAAMMKGTATAVEDGDRVKITVSLSDAPPGTHGVHVHTAGSCDDNDAGMIGAAGPHFNPTGAMHGDLNKGHGGDLGNIEVDDDGKGQLTVTSTILKIPEGGAGLLNRAIVIHEGEDDLATDPAGNSGARIGCGIFR